MNRVVRDERVRKQGIADDDAAKVKFAGYELGVGLFSVGSRRRYENELVIAVWSDFVVKRASHVLVNLDDFFAEFLLLRKHDAKLGAP